MCVPTEKTLSEIVFCSNCGSEKVTTKWVYKYGKQEPKRISIEEKIKTKIEPPNSFTIFSGFSCGDCNIISIPIQLNLICENCGYTVSKEVEMNH